MLRTLVTKQKQTIMRANEISSGLCRLGRYIGDESMEGGCKALVLMGALGGAAITSIAFVVGGLLSNKD